MRMLPLEVKIFVNIQLDVICADMVDFRRLSHIYQLADFSKAFDTVPHQRLLSKLRHYGINGNIHNWIQSWLTTRCQCVVLDGESSFAVSVLSGVPQGTLMFLLYINDIVHDIHSPLQLFTDDCLLYRIIHCVLDRYHPSCTILF